MTRTPSRRGEVTHFTDYDIDFPALGGDAIAFQQGGKLYLLDLPERAAATRCRSAYRTTVCAPGRMWPTSRTKFARPIRRSRWITRWRQTASEPCSRRAATSSACRPKNGATRDLTSTPGIDEDHPAWSPDGRTIAYTTDAGGGQQIAIRPAEGGPERILTSFAEGYFYGPVFSPDGKTLAFRDGAHRLWIVGTDGGAPKQVAQDKLTRNPRSGILAGRALACLQPVRDGRRRDLVSVRNRHRQIDADRRRQRNRCQSRSGRPTASISISPPAGTKIRSVGHRVRFRDPEVRGNLCASRWRATPPRRSRRSPTRRSGASDDTPGKPRRGRARQETKPASTKSGQGRPAKPARRSARPDQADPHRPRRHDGARRRAADRCRRTSPSSMCADDRIFYLTQPLRTDRRQRSTARSRRCTSTTSRSARTGVVTEDVDSYSLSLDGQKVLIRHEKDYTVLDDQGRRRQGRRDQEAR